MSDKNENKIHGVVAEFTSVASLLAACERVRDEGYTKTDAYTPFPVHGIDTALGIKPTVLPWIVLCCGLTGTATALVMQIWMNSINYPYIISGKPFISLPAFIPVAFELTILFASFGAFFGMWLLNGLPRFSNPVFTDPRFDRATDDRFFLYIDAKDSRFNQTQVEKLLADTGSDYVQSVVEDESPKKVPKFIVTTWITVMVLSIIPLLIVLKMRVTNSGSPRFHVFYDMDFSPSKDAQQNSTLFADSRAMRPDVPGTVSRGQMDLNFQTGIDVDKLTQIDPLGAERLVFAVNADVDPATKDEKPEAAPPSVMDTTPWLKENPREITLDLVEKGQQQFGIYCSVCHGLNGGGNGLVNRRAQKILAATWIPPSSLHQEILYADKYPDGKLFNTISNGIRKMPGYASQIKVEDRWAIVAYVRALQNSQNASMDLVPKAKQKDLEKKKSEIDKKLKEQAEAEKKAADAATAKAEAEAKAAEAAAAKDPT